MALGHCNLRVVEERLLRRREGEVLADEGVSRGRRLVLPALEGDGEGLQRAHGLVVLVGVDGIPCTTTNDIITN